MTIHGLHLRLNGDGMLAAGPNPTRRSAHVCMCSRGADRMAGFRYLEGALNARFDVTGAGGTTKTLAKSLQGTAEVTFADGAIRGIDIADVYNNLVRLMSSGFKQDDSKATTFTELGASFAIEGGVARTEDIKLVGPLVRMRAKPL